MSVSTPNETQHQAFERKPVGASAIKKGLGPLTALLSPICFRSKIFDLARQMIGANKFALTHFVV